MNRVKNMISSLSEEYGIQTSEAMPLLEVRFDIKGNRIFDTQEK